jgi:hypothetical protein
MVFTCADCNAILLVRPTGFGALFGGDYQPNWYMVKDRVWQSGQRSGKECRFLCIECLERRVGRKLTAKDFSRSNKVNFQGGKSPELRRRMRGLKPAKRLVTTMFTP